MARKRKTDEVKGEYKVETAKDLCISENIPFIHKCGNCANWTFNNRLTGKDLGACPFHGTLTERNYVCEHWKVTNG